ncbi:MAG: coproporphyrinogen III oxidase, partial [Wolbachia endosymbiont of Andrena agilissima]|nr:coproporphyrinogen III oxidase [Wolbachia endosymbiont of Andrena agilissima]
SGNWENDFEFTKAVGEAFLEIYSHVIRKHMQKSWTKEQRENQLIKRGRYVEFNLLYDRGTRFGLMTDGNPDAIMMSMPPLVKWL